MSYIEANVAEARLENHKQQLTILLAEMKQNLENYKQASRNIILSSNTRGLGNFNRIDVGGQNEASTDTEFDIRFREQQQQYQQKMDEVSSLLDTLAADSASIKDIVSNNLNSIPAMPTINPNDEEASAEKREHDLRENIMNAYFNIGGAVLTLGILGGIYYIRYRR
jgi:hypothetical protein